MIPSHYKPPNHDNHLIKLARPAPYRMRTQTVKEKLRFVVTPFRSSLVLHHINCFPIRGLPALGCSRIDYPFRGRIGSKKYLPSTLRWCIAASQVLLVSAVAHVA